MKGAAMTVSLLCSLLAALAFVVLLRVVNVSYD